MPSVWRRLGLQARITFLFATGGLLLSILMATSTLTFARRNLIEDRRQRAFAVLVRNAIQLNDRLDNETDPEDIDLIFDTLTVTERSFPLLNFQDRWTSEQTLVFNEDNIPAALVDYVAEGSAARITTSLNDKPAFIMGIPIPGVEAAYYEAALADDVEQALRILGIIVTGVAVATTLLAAATGAWASRRVLTPLAEVRGAAESLAAGELDTRLDPPADADLASLTASFNRMARTLEDRIERDARFASAVSHELRSPLMTLNASIEVLQNNCEELSARSRTALDLLTDDAIRFTHLIEDLLEINRYDVGTASLHAERLDLVEFVRQCIAHSPFSANLDVGNLSVLPITGDKRRLKQVVTNLLDNATKYGHDLRVELAEQDKWASLAVEDHGPGVPPDEREIIFDRFSRGSAGRHRGHGTGTGLGLSLVAEHVGLHGGHVKVEDRLDGQSGARFVVKLALRVPRLNLDTDNVESAEHKQET